MGNLSQKELELFSNKILEDYDAKNPGTIFKDKIKISNEEALIIQSIVANLRKKRGEEERRSNHGLFAMYHKSEARYRFAKICK